MNKVVFEVGFIIDEDEVIGATKWLCNYTEGMPILYASYREAKPEEVEVAEVIAGLRDEPEVEDV